MKQVISINFFAGAGYVVEAGQLFVTQSGRPKVTFRMVIPRHPRLPKKNPARGDFYSVIALGDQFVPLVDHLKRGTPVVVIGYAQSRDVSVNGQKRTVNEIGADAVFLIRQLSSKDNNQ